MLAIITKMTLTQVSTWFANARRRLKKENKMTWEPRNRVEDEDNNNEDDDSGRKSVDEKDRLGESYLSLLKFDKKIQNATARAFERISSLLFITKRLSHIIFYDYSVIQNFIRVYLEIRIETTLVRITETCFFLVQIRKTQVQVLAKTGNDLRIVSTFYTVAAADRRAFKVGPRASGASRERTAAQTVRSACTTKGSRGIRYSFNTRHISRPITVDCYVIRRRRARHRVTSIIIYRRPPVRRPPPAL